MELIATGLRGSSSKSSSSHILRCKFDATGSKWELDSMKRQARGEVGHETQIKWSEKVVEYGR